MWTVGNTWVPAGVSTAGIVLTLAGLVDGAYRLTGPLAVSGTFLAGLATGLPFAVLLIGGGYWLTRSAIDRTFYRRIASWTTAGATGFTVLIGLFAPLIFQTAISYAGTLRWALSIGGGGGFLIGVFNVCMIERMLAAERASVQAEEAEQRREFLKYLNALLRHEVLNTANVIDGHAGLLEQEVGESDRPAIIRQQATDLTEIINDVRFLVTASDEPETTRPIDVRTVMAAELRRLDNRYSAVSIDADFPAELMVSADDLLNRLFRNVFENAVEHSENTPTVTVRASLDAETVAVRITDNGPGVPSDLQSNLFDPTVSRRDDESRLGTVIVGRLAERYDGDVTVVDTGPTGTTIRVRLPRADTTDSPPTTTRAAASSVFTAEND